MRRLRAGLVLAWATFVLSVGVPPAQLTALPFGADIRVSPQTGVQVPPALTHARVGDEPAAPGSDTGLWFGDLRFPATASQVSFILPTPNSNVAIPDVTLMRWFDGMQDTDLYSPEANLAIGWQDGHGRTGIWVHSGGDTAFTPLRNSLELGDFGNLRTPFMVAGAVGLLVGEPATVIWRGEAQPATVTAAVRVEPVEVEGMEARLMDMPEYLNDLYPGADFQTVHDGTDYLILVFCGRSLGDTLVPNVEWWQQARFIIVLARAD